MPRDQIQEVKDKLDIVSVISGYVSLTKAGKNYKALCPFHAEKTPSFMVSPELQIFKCFGCGEGGDVISFYAKMEGVGFGDALREMAKRAGVRLIRRKKTPEEERRETVLEINRLASDYFHYLLIGHAVGKEAREFLEKRGVSKDSVEVFNLGYAPDSWDSLGKFVLSKNYTLTDYLTSGLGVRKDPSTSSGKDRGFYDFFRGRLIFPFRSPTGRVVGFSARALGNEEPKYIHTSETPVFKKRRFLYNMDLAKSGMRRKKETIIVEGMMDVIALYEKGIGNVVATMGTALTSEQIAMLARFANSIKLCFDKDTAGLEATKRGIMLAQGVGLEVRAVLLPKGKDPDEAIRGDEKSFRQAIDKAPPIFDFYLKSALDRFGSNTASAKRKVAGELLPVVKSLANEVEKAAYLKELSEVLNIPEESLWRQLEKEEPLEVARAPAARAEKPLYPQREGRLLALILSLPPKEAKKYKPASQSSLSHSARKWLHKLSPEDFSNPRLREIFTELKAYLARVKRFRLANFSAKLDEKYQAVLEELVLMPTSDQVPLEEELEALVQRVKKVRYQREKQELVGAVKEAEAEGRAKDVKKLQKEVLELSEKISKLD
jgi:DNA primase